MQSVYNVEWLHNLAINKETKRWFKQGFITKTQFEAIQKTFSCGFYHPNFTIRIVIFVATLIGLSGVTGLLALMFADAGDEVLNTGSVVYGIASFVFLDLTFIKSGNHYKSGLTEALLYHACGFTLLGIGLLTDGNEHTVLLSSLIVFGFAAFRYLDLLTTVAAFASFAGLVFYEFYNLGGVFQHIIPFVFLGCFTPLYFYIRSLKLKPETGVWHNNLIVLEALCLLMMYASGNYLVVRELSSEMMNLHLEEGEDIPYAFIFYFLTVAIPITYLFFGLKNKDLVLLRVSLIVIAFSMFTFKYYFSLGHPEITLTAAGTILTAITLLIMNYLKTIRHGFTRENLLEEKWGSMNVQGILISQTMGGNTIADSFKGQGGGFGGGGATGEY